jgi:hypothetical protein
VPTSADRGYHVVSATDPHGFLDREIHLHTFKNTKIYKYKPVLSNKFTVLLSTHTGRLLINYAFELCIAVVLILLN